MIILNSSHAVLHM